MSLLASEGIGVFNKRHAVIADTNVEVTSPNSPTHQFTWMALEHWTDRKISSELLAEVISPGGISLSEWFNAFNISSSLHPIGRQWLKTWGVDIKQFSDDRVLRNHSSYRPSRIVNQSHLAAPESISFLKELWKMCEPSPSSRFNEIDRHLLRISLARAYNAVYGLNPELPSNLQDYTLWVEQKIQTLGFSTSINKAWIDFLTWHTQPQNPQLIEEASQVSSITDPNYAIQVLARSTLLLRISTGAAGKVLRESGFQKDDLDFWWQPYAIENGIIGNGASITDFLDLWLDTGTALKDILEWETSMGFNYSYSDLVRNVSRQLFCLGEGERVALWGLGI